MSEPNNAGRTAGAHVWALALILAAVAIGCTVAGCFLLAGLAWSLVLVGVYAGGLAVVLIGGVHRLGGMNGRNSDR